jgi:hypothetical protein
VETVSPRQSRGLLLLAPVVVVVPEGTLSEAVSVVLVAAAGVQELTVTLFLEPQIPVVVEAVVTLFAESRPVLAGQVLSS